jgi:hypothetical protein
MFAGLPDFVTASSTRPSYLNPILRANDLAGKLDSSINPLTRLILGRAKISAKTILAASSTNPVRHALRAVATWKSPLWMVKLPGVRTGSKIPIPTSGASA